MKVLFLILKGILIGLALIIPGISAGTMALITGLYSRLIYFLSSFRLRLFKSKKEYSNVWEDFYSLAPVFLGCVVGLSLGVKWVSFFILFYPWQTYSLFSGVILGSVPFLLFQTKINKINILIFIVSAGLTLNLSFASLNISSGYLWAFFSVYIAGGALLLPGVSGSYILMIMGTYSTLLSDIKFLVWWKIGFYFLAGVLSLLSFSKLIRFLLKNYSSQTMACLTGMTLGGGIGIFLFTEQVFENPSLSLLLLSSSLIFIVAIQFFWRQRQARK